MTSWNATMIDRHRAALVLVDLQNDFLPSGALPVPHGDRILDGVRSLVDSLHFRLVVATQDWHPPRHVSFASSHAGHRPSDRISLSGHEQVLWPDHCVAGTPGAELYRDLPWQHVRAIVRKGTDLDVDSYSGFRNNWNELGERRPTGLGGLLKECGATEVYVCGLARDVCVLWTAQDAAELGFKTTVIWDLTRPVDIETDPGTERLLAASGVQLVDAGSLR